MNLFEIVGPVMIGPSSSHTAGAARIGRVTRLLLGEKPVYADIGFHGSFAKTWEGHGADRAVVGGLLDMRVDDERLRMSLKIAADEGLTVRLRAISLQDAHPNTIVITARGESGAEITVQSASVGGGAIRVQYLDGLEVGFSGDKPTVVIKHRDEPGVIAEVSGALAREKINIAAMRVFRSEAHGRAVMVLELDETPRAELLAALKALRGVRAVTLLDAL